MDNIHVYCLPAIKKINNPALKNEAFNQLARTENNYTIKNEYLSSALWGKVNKGLLSVLQNSANIEK